MCPCETYPLRDQWGLLQNAMDVENMSHDERCDLQTALIFDQLPDRAIARTMVVNGEPNPEQATFQDQYNHETEYPWSGQC